MPAHGPGLAGLSGLERLEAVQRLVHEAGMQVLDVIDQDRVAVREQSFLVVGALLDGNAQDVVILRELFLRRIGERERALPARPACPGRHPPLRRLVLPGLLTRLRRFALLGARARARRW